MTEPDPMSEASAATTASAGPTAAATSATHAREVLQATFAEGLGIAPEAVVPGLAYNQHPRWDSTAHLQLVMALEARFGFTLEMQDMLDMSSLEEAERILGKYGIRFADQG